MARTKPAPALRGVELVKRVIARVEHEGRLRPKPVPAEALARLQQVGRLDEGVAGAVAKHLKAVPAGVLGSMWLLLDAPNLIRKELLLEPKRPPAKAPRAGRRAKAV